MSRAKKRLAVIGSGVAVTALAIGGVAFAAFNQTANASAAGAGTETFAPLSVTGLWLGRPGTASGGGYGTDAKLLLPGESGDVSLTLTNPSTNTVQGKVVSITPAALDDSCGNNIQLATYNPGNALVLNHGVNFTVTLKSAVTLKPEATELCQGKRFTPTYLVKFEATRDPVQTPSSIQPGPAGPAAPTVQ